MCPNGHKFNISFHKWKAGVRCKYCFYGSKRKSFEEIEKSLNDEGYTLLSNNSDYKNDTSKLSAICPNGHKFTFVYQSWRSGSRCPTCAVETRANKLRLDYQYVANNISKAGFELLSKDYKNAFEKIEIECPNGHIYTVKWNDWQQGGRCPKCNRLNSKGEFELANFIEKLGFNIVRNDRCLIGPKELDIVIPDKKLAVEYCGLYWHSELFVEKQYHVKKLEECLDIGYNLLTIFSDEWLYKRAIVESRLRYILNSADIESVYARKCVIKQISASLKNEFLKTNHIQGPDVSSICLGAYYNDMLVAVMTFSKGNISKGCRPIEGVWELNRFCSHINYNVVGIASKLLKYFENNYKWNKIFSYADRRWSDGGLYEKLGFKLEKITQLNYWYSKDGLKRIHRFNLRKQKDESGTEFELRSGEGYFRIWDCGNLKFTMVKGELI